MALSVPATKTALAAWLDANKFLYGAVFTTAPSGATPGTEPSGGSPAYARKALTWTAGAAGVATASATFDIPASTNINGSGIFDAATAGNYQEGRTETTTTFSAQGQLIVNWTLTVS